MLKLNDDTSIPLLTTELLTILAIRLGKKGSVKLTGRCELGLAAESNMQRKNLAKQGSKRERRMEEGGEQKGRRGPEVKISEH